LFRFIAILILNFSAIGLAQDTTTTPTVAPITPAADETTATGSSTTSQWSGCVDLNEGIADIGIGDLTTVCLQIGNQLNWANGASYIRASFQPEADQYSRLHIPNCTCMSKLSISSLYEGYVS
jgi:hypothetical protein